MCSDSDTQAHSLVRGASAAAGAWAAPGQVVAAVSPPLTASPHLDNASLLHSDTSSVHYTVSFLLTTAGYWRTAVSPPPLSPRRPPSPRLPALAYTIAY